MNPSILEVEVAETAATCPAALISDDDIPWDEILADARSGERGHVFDPADYESDEAMMAAAEALLLKWAGDDSDEG